MLLFDVFKGQITDKATKFIEDNNCVIVHVPNNMTDHVQQFDLNVNCHTKEFLKQKFECWYAEQIINQPEGGSSVYDAKAPLKLSIVKLIHAKWLLSLYDHLRNNEECNLRNALVMELLNALLLSSIKFIF